jgi:hypothetical protein
MTMKMQGIWSRLAVAMLSLAAGACSAGDSDSKGVEGHFILSEKAVAADAGLPAYPGSKAYTDDDDSNSAANIALSTSLFGFKVIAMNMESADRPEQVAAFYRRAMSKYGTVLECSESADIGKQPESTDGLTCESDEPGSHSVVYKVGTDENQRIVAIKPHGSGTRFDLVHFDIRGKSKK